MATALTMLTHGGAPHEGRQKVAHGDVLGDLRFDGHLVVHAQRRMDADAIERTERAVAQCCTLLGVRPAAANTASGFVRRRCSSSGSWNRRASSAFTARCGWSVHAFTCACRKVLVAAMKSAGASSIAQWPQWGMK